MSEDFNELLYRKVSSDLTENWTDHYFLKTKKVVESKGDKTVTYAVFMRRPVLFAPKLMIEIGRAPV